MIPSQDDSRYQKGMTYNRCGRSGLKLPRLSLGGWHHFTTFEKAKELTLAAFDAGVTHIDLANNYGPPPGQAEVAFGEVLYKELAAHRHELVLSTKAGYRMWPGPYGEFSSRKYLLQSLDQSLERLGVDHVDIFYSHRLDADTPLEETMSALDTAVRSGKALYAGISSYNAIATRKAAHIMQELGTPLLIHQCAYNMFHRRLEDAVLSATHEHGLGMIVFSPLAQGMLTDRYLKGIPKDSRAADPDGFLQESQVTKENVEKARQLNELAKERGQTLSRMALQWVARLEGVTSVLIGASKASQIKDNLKFVQDEQDKPFTADELRHIDTILK